MSDRRKEIERLVSEYGAESYAGALPGREYKAHGVLMAAIDSLFDALEESERNARRYRWLRDTNDLDWFVNGKVVHDFGPMPEGAKEGFFGVTTFIGRQRGESLDMAIDAAIAQEPKP